MNRQLLNLTLPVVIALAAAPAVAQMPPLPGYMPQMPAGPAFGPQGTLGQMPPQQPVWSGAPPANLSEPSNLLREGIDKLRAFLDYADNKEPAKVAAFLDREITPYFDFGYMAHLVAGPAAQRMSQEQRLQFKDALRTQFLTAMAQNLSRYQGGEMQYLPQSGGRDDLRLRVRVVQRGQPAVMLEFKLYPSQSGWKIYDVAANGLSAVQYFRQNAGQFLRSAEPAMGPGPR
jgi:phospholipid transport system substrate-binding protein